MTELLSAEDIKKAVGAFTGEQRAPLPALPLRPSPWPLRPRGPRAPRGRSVLPCAPLLCPCIPRGAGWAGMGVLSISHTLTRRDLGQGVRGKARRPA